MHVSKGLLADDATRATRNDATFEVRGCGIASSARAHAYRTVALIHTVI